MEDGLSVIVPVYNEAQILEGFFEKLAIFSKDTEIIFVDGGSTDSTFEKIKKVDIRSIVEIKVGESS